MGMPILGRYCRISVAAMVCIVNLSVLSVDAATRTNTFSVAPEWAAKNTSFNGNSYGYSASTTNAGGSVGEIGGIFARTVTNSYYADTNMGASFSRSSRLSAQGLLDVTGAQNANNDAHIGYFDASATTWTNMDRLGISIAEVSGSNKYVRFRAYIRFADGTETNGNNLVISTNLDRTWSMQWDPSTNSGRGRLTATVSGGDGGTSTLDVVQAHSNRTFSLNAFGLANNAMNSAGAGQTITFYVDNLQYTVDPATPVATPQSNVTTIANLPVAITLAGTDADGDPLTYAVVTGPAHGSLSGTPPNVTYTPTPGYEGSDQFTFSVNDGMVDSNPATVTILVKRDPGTVLMVE